MSSIREYYHLTKPGIIYGNLMTTVGGFLFGARGEFNLVTLLGLLVGTAGVIACGCVLNNYLDRGIDVHMTRTKTRALVTGTISPQAALLYGAMLGIVGLDVLCLTTNPLTVILGIVALVSYVLVYTFLKRHSVHGTLAGTIPGAIPLVAGYAAATGQLDRTAGLLFIIMALWQMAHFYAIAIYRFKDYSAAKIPVMPVVHGITLTKLYASIYIGCFTVAAVALTAFGGAGLIYLFGMLVLSIWWFSAALQGHELADRTWAGRVFGKSLVVLTTFSALLAVNSWIP